MKIGLLRINLRIPSCESLKAKRSIVKRYINHIRREYNVSVAEIGNHDKRYVCTLGIVTIYGNNDNVDKTLHAIVSFFEQSPDVQVWDYLIEMI